MIKEKIPKFFSFDIINICITIISFIALFGFWNDLNDRKKILYVILPIIFIFLFVNLIKYFISVRKFYGQYDDLFKKYQALVQNYEKNISELKQIKYNNEILSDFINKTMMVLVIYNDMTEQEKVIARADIIKKFVKNNLEGGSDNE